MALDLAENPEAQTPHYRRMNHFPLILASPIDMVVENAAGQRAV